MIENSIKQIIDVTKNSHVSMDDRRIIEKDIANILVDIADSYIRGENFQMAEIFLRQARSFDLNNMRIRRKIYEISNEKKVCRQFRTDKSVGEIFYNALQCSRDLEGSLSSKLKNLYKIKGSLKFLLTKISNSAEIYNLLGWVNINIHMLTVDNMDEEGYIQKLQRNLITIFGGDRKSILMKPSISLRLGLRSVKMIKRFR